MSQLFLLPCTYHACVSLTQPQGRSLQPTILHLTQGKDGDRGVTKIKALHDNANFVRQRLHEMGCAILGDDDSPVVVCQVGCNLCRVCPVHVGAIHEAHVCHTVMQHWCYCCPALPRLVADDCRICHQSCCTWLNNASTKCMPSS